LIPKNTCKDLEDFYNASDDNQKQYFDLPAKKKLGEAVVRGSFNVLQNFKADARVI